MSQWPGAEYTQSMGEHIHSATKRRRMPFWAKALIVIGAIGSVLTVLICGGLIYLGTVSPDTKAVPGSRMRQRDLAAVRALNLLEPGEQIQFFYSDGLLDVKEGMYFYTDRKVVIYVADSNEPRIEIPFDQIVEIDVDYSDSWFVDSTIWLTMTDDSVATLYVCKEAGGDRKFYNGLVAMWRQKSGRP